MRVGKRIACDVPSWLITKTGCHNYQVTGKPPASAPKHENNNDYEREFEFDHVVSAQLASHHREILLPGLPLMS